jgi:hypothetical protein
VVASTGAATGVSNSEEQATVRTGCFAFAAGSEFVVDTGAF